MVFHWDVSKSMRTSIKDLMNQAMKRQSEQSGYHIVGTVMQHLVGAKLSLLLDSPPEMHGASVADVASAREGDFQVEDVVIHVTSAPSEALLRKCKSNLENGLRPIIIITYRGIVVAEELAKTTNIDERIDIFDVEQFLTSNFYELGQFTRHGRRNIAEQLIKKYNEIIDKCETDPSLKIAID